MASKQQRHARPQPVRAPETPLALEVDEASNSAMAESMQGPELVDESPLLDQAVEEEQQEAALGAVEAGTEKAGDPTDGEPSGNGGGGGGAPGGGGNPDEGDVEVEGAAGSEVPAAQQAAPPTPDPGADTAAEPEESSGPVRESQGESAASAPPTGGGHGVRQETAPAPTRTPSLGVASVSRIGGTVDDAMAAAIQEHTGQSADAHAAAARAEVDALQAEISTLQAEQVALADAAALETRARLSGEYSGLVQGDIASVVAATGGAYADGARRVLAAAETVKSGIDAAAAGSATTLFTTAAGATLTLAGAVLEARGRLEELRTTWSGAFTEVETRRGDEFSAAARSAADQLVANKSAIAATFLGQGDAIARAEGELKAKAAEKMVDDDAERMRAAGPTRAAQEITDLGHAEIVDGWISPLETRVDTVSEQGAAAIAAARQTASEQIEQDRIAARDKVDADAQAAAEQLGSDAEVAQEDAEVAGEQLEADLDTDLTDVDARFTDTSAVVADRWAAFAEQLAAALDTDAFLDAGTVERFVATQRETLAQLATDNETLIRDAADNADTTLRGHLDTARETYLGLIEQNRQEADRLAGDKITALEAIGTAFSESLVITAESVTASVSAWTDPLGADFSGYVSEIEAQIATRQVDADTRLGERLGVYESELATEVDTYAENIDPSPAAEGLRESLRTICLDAWDAMEGWGTDEDALFDALRGIETPAMGEAVEAYWPTIHPGARGVKAQLRSFCRDDLSSSEFRIAEAYLRGDRAEGARLELDDNMNWYNDDEAQIEKILRSLDDSDRDAMQDLPGWEETGARLQSNLDGTDLDVTDALLVNNVARADAYRLRDQIDEARRKGDDDALHTALAGMDPSRREQIAQEFHHIQNDIEADAVGVEPIEQDVAFAELVDYSTREVETSGYVEGGSYDRDKHRYVDSVDGASADLVDALVRSGNDSLEADVARFEVERNRRGGPKEENVETALMMSADDQAALRDPEHPRHEEALARQARRQSDFEAMWQERYGGEDGPASVNDALGEMYEHSDNAALETEVHRAMLEDGTNSARVVALVSELSVDGAGTDEERMTRIWSGLTPQEADEAQELWAERFAEGDETLEDRLFGGHFSEYSGDEGHDLRVQMLGDSQYFTGEYADRHKELADLEAAYSEEGWLNTQARDSMRINHQRLEDFLAEVAAEHDGSAFDAQGRFQGTDEQYERYKELCILVGMNAASHRKAVDAIADMTTTAIAITGAVLAAVLTGGAAAPLVAAMWAAGAGLASMGANYAMKGGRYGWEEAAQDLGETAVAAGTAGAGKWLENSKYMEGLITNKALREVSIEATTGFVGGAGNTALADQTWEGDNGIGETLYSGFTGGLSGGASKGTGFLFDATPVGRYLDQDHLLASATAGGLKGSLGTAVGETTTMTSDYLFRDRTVDLGDAVERVGTESMKSFGTKFLEGGAERYGKRRLEARTRLEQATEEFRAAEAEVSTQLETNDVENAGEVLEIERRAAEGVHEDDQGQLVATGVESETQGDLDAVADDYLATDREVVDRMKGHLDDVQTALDEVETVEAETSQNEQVEQGPETTRQQGPETSQQGPETQQTAPVDDSRAYQEELLLHRLIELEEQGQHELVEAILADPERALERADELLPRS